MHPLLNESKRGPSWISLITKAILSTPNKKMTLNDIYRWLIANVGICGESSNLRSTEGWKNCVRHTLSARPQFVRLPDRTQMGCYWTVDEEIVEAKCRRSASCTNLISKRVDKKKQRPRSLPGLHDIRQLDEQEMQQLTVMLQNAIESNPNLEQHLSALNL